MQPGLRDLLDKRRNRTISHILGVKEREIDPLLPDDRRADEASDKLRKAVLDQVNDFVNFVVDVLDSFDTGEVMLNQSYLQKIDDMHRELVGTNNGHG